MKGNTCFSTLDPVSQKEIKEKVKQHKLSYKNNIGLDKDITFGVEIEAIAPYFIELMRQRKNILYYEFPDSKPSNVYSLNKWIVTNDATLNDKGGELCSPILKDDKYSWQNLRSLLKYLKKHLAGVHVDKSCANHIHIGADIFQSDPEKLFSAMVLLAENEDILTRFFNGSFINLRSYADIYARPFADFLMSSQPINIASISTILSSLYDIDKLNVDYKVHSFDFASMFLHDKFGNYQNTFENRLPNGSVDEIIIQNNIMVTGQILMHAVSGNYDYEKGLYNIEKSNRREDNIDDEKAFYVADFLQNDEFKLDFLKQYYKDGTTTKSKQLKKSLEFF